MIGYGMAKAAVHQLTKSLAADGSGMPSNCLVVATLPITLDTPMNRKFMANADTSTWTPLEYMAEWVFLMFVLLPQLWQYFVLQYVLQVVQRWEPSQDRKSHHSGHQKQCYGTGLWLNSAVLKKLKAPKCNGQISLWVWFFCNRQYEFPFFLNRFYFQLLQAKTVFWFDP